jgi:REP element-mobilizing transposase RayT
MIRGETLVDIGAYCLMSNHFHLLLHEKTENGISIFMAKLLTAYSMYFNKRHVRTGALFEGRFLAKHADKDDYLQYLFSYIHLNPVKIIEPTWKVDGILNMKKTKQYLDDYFYSSYRDYMGEKREENLILNKNAFPEYFENFKEFEQYIDAWLTYNETEEITI